MAGDESMSRQREVKAQIPLSPLEAPADHSHGDDILEGYGCTMHQQAGSDAGADTVSAATGSAQTNGKRRDAWGAFPGRRPIVTRSHTPRWLHRALLKVGWDTDVKVNQTQFLFDSRWRALRFFVREGAVFRHLVNRGQWYFYPKLHHTASAPLHVDIESTSICNMKCPMCYKFLMVKEQYRFIRYELFQSAVDECADMGVYSVRLSWRGEPLMHPRILDMVRYVRERGIPHVSLLSNGLLLDEAMSRGLIEAGLTYVSVSFDGTDDIYERIRRPAKFWEAVERLRTLKRLREGMGRTNPLIRVATIWPAAARNPERYQRILGEVTDKMMFNRFIDFHSLGAPDPDFVCHYPWQRLTVASDGSIVPCTSDTRQRYVLGHIGTDRLADVWHGNKLRDLRDKHAAKRRCEVTACADCTVGITKPPRRWAEGWDPDTSAVIE